MTYEGPRRLSWDTSVLYHHLPNWPEDRIRPLMETFGSMLIEQRAFREVFGVI